jgi:hypothetical protein
MNDPYPVPARDHTTWQCDAEKISEQLPQRWRRPLDIAAGVVAAVC